MTTVQDPTPTPADESPGLVSSEGSFGGIVSGYLAKIRGGDVGALPAVLGLVVLAIVFSALRPSTFTGPGNFANLINQSAAVTVIAMGLVFVLLLGEIDLSAGYTGGTAAAVTGVVMTNHHQSWVVSLIVGLLTGAAIGLAIGALVARLGIPSFVVTLAAFLGLQGVLLGIIGPGGTIAYTNSVVLALNNKSLAPWLGIVLAIVSVAAYATLTFVRNQRRRANNLQAEPQVLWLMKVTSVAVIVAAVTYYLSIERSPHPNVISIKGVPIVLVVIVALMIVLTFALTRTSWGLHVYAVGGNAEAARRAGINVTRIKISCFVISSTLAAVGGVLIGSRDNSVSPTTGGTQTLLYAVGAAVIGGTSLFGGKGRVVDALIGGTVIAVISNGMGLLNKEAGTVYEVTGVVLLVAASVDAITRRRASATGRV